MTYLRLPLAMFSRRRPLAAACLSALSFVLLWMGFGVSDLLPAPRVAVAESAPMNHHDAPSVLSPERAGILQSSVDSLALGLGSALTTLSSDSARQTALANSLSSLTFELGGEAYFTAWQGTRIIHSPLTPDTMGMDFADALDERGSAFVRTMENVAENGGGFVKVVLPRQLPPRLSGGYAVGGATSSVPLRMNMDDAKVSEGLESLSASIVEGAAASDAVSVGKPLHAGPVIVRGAGIQEIQATTTPEPACPVQSAPASGAGKLNKATQREKAVKPGDPNRVRPGGSCAPTVMDSTPVDQVVYVRQIPQSVWYIAAFMPVTASPGFAGQGFSPAWSAAAADRSALLAAENDFRNGLCVSGFSLAGLAGLLMTPGRRRETTQEEA